MADQSVGLEALEATNRKLTDRFLEVGKGAETTRITFLLLNEFSLIAFSTALEPLRIANRLLGRRIYDYSVYTKDGNPVQSSGGIVTGADGSLDQLRSQLKRLDKPEFIFLVTGINVQTHAEDKALLGFVRDAARSGVRIGGLCTASYVLAAAGLLDGKRCAIHWEELPGFAERFPKADVYADLFEIDGNIYTCAGGTAPLDMMISLFAERHDDTLVNAVCEQALTDRVRNPHDRQRLPLRARLGVQNSKVLSVIEVMEANISEPLSLVEVAGFIGLSRRQVERLFRREMGRSPARYYLELRLERARHLLLQSSMPIVEIAFACGFISASHFSKCYRELYGKSPQLERNSRDEVEVSV
jgi:transcriptional regulator GlxA family with amidase domain